MDWTAIRAVDAHVHLATEEWVDQCMGVYQESIEQYFRRPVVSGTLDDMVAQYRGRGLVGILLAWDAERNTGRPPLSNERVSDICRQYPDVFVGFGSVDPLRSDALKRLRKLPELGLHGLKLHPSLQGFDPADPSLDEFFFEADRLSLPLLVHTGTSGVGARQPGGQGLRIDVAHPLRWDRLAAAYPHLNILLAHIGWPWHLDALAMALHKSNVYLDISGWKYRYLPPEVLREMRTRLQDQVLFGTDFPMFEVAAQLDEFAQLNLPEPISEKIMRTNAVRYLGWER